MTKYILTTISALILISLGTYFYLLAPSDQVSPQLWQKVALTVHTRWAKGDDEGEWSKGKLTCDGILAPPNNTDKNYLSCNPNFLYCWYKHYRESVFYQGKQYSFKVSFLPGKSLPFRREGEALLLTIERGEEKFALSLFDTCSEVYLPKRHYSYGPYTTPQQEWRWDNFKQDIFVDKFMVSQRDIWEWQRATSGKSKIDFKLFPHPADNLKLEQMRSYCSYRGQELMKAHVFDGVAFHPGDIENPRPRVNIRGSYPWTSERISLEKDRDFAMGMCLRLFSKDCLEIDPYQNFSHRSMSWTGMAQVLGGVMEVQENPIEGEKNLMLSSWYYPFNSGVHQLGHRGHWKGSGHRAEDFDFGENIPIPLGDKKSHYRVGFRCMRLLANPPFPWPVLKNPYPSSLSSPDTLKDKLKEVLAYARGVEHEKRVLSATLSRPRGVWFRLLRADDYCLFFKTPVEEVKGGQLRLVADCTSVYAKDYFSLEGISQFQMSVEEGKTFFSFVREGRKKTWEISRFNDLAFRPFKRYDSPFLKGALLNGWPVKQKKIVGNVICHQVDSKCRDIKKNNCHLCPNGHFEVVNFNCPQGGSKYCGQNRCGENNALACPRGFSANRVRIKSCQSNWSAGFCQKGLRSICNSKGELICVK